MARPRAKSRLGGCLRVGAVMLLLLTVGGGWRCRDRSRGYRLELSFVAPAAPSLRVGFATADITPELPDSWTDADGNGKFEPKRGDTWTDGNGNGRFDALYLAGFGNNRPAAGVLDRIEATACLLDDGTHRVGIVALDAIGFFHDDVVAVRRSLPAELALDHLIIASSHCHEVPDLMGIWGPSPLRCGVDPGYRDLVRRRAVEAIAAASAALRPAVMRLYRVPDVRDGLVRDSRQPEVHDADLRLVGFVGEHGETLGTLLGWANHPETLWDKNLLVSSDFVGPFRDGVEQGVGDLPGVGGVALFLNGAIGGLLTPSRSMDIADPLSDAVYQEPSPDKARALGQTLALRALAAMADEPLATVEQAGLSLVARTLTLRLDNKLFRLAPLLGVIDRGYTGFGKLRSEVNLLRLGPVWLLTVPGELYPEIANGGVETPPGADYPVPPLELPPWRERMLGELNFVVGLGNDEVGYIIPHSEWDTRPPYLYDKEKSPYGEINSLGPATAPDLHAAVMGILDEAGAGVGP